MTTKSKLRLASPAGRHALLNIANGRDVDYGLSGRSATRGVKTTVAALKRSSLVQGDGTLSPTGVEMVARITAFMTSPLQELFAKVPVDWSPLPDGVSSMNYAVAALERQGLIECTYICRGNGMPVLESGWCWRRLPTALRRRARAAAS